MDIQEVKQAIEKIEARIEFLKTDKTVWTSAWAGPKGYTPYNHGPYLRKLETKRLKAKLKRLKKTIQSGGGIGNSSWAIKDAGNGRQRDS